MLFVLGEVAKGVAGGVAVGRFNQIICLGITVFPESLAVAVAWLLLTLSGRWHRERGWIDWLGLSLGVWWLVIPPLLSVLAVVVEILWV
jgi:hypothetical protein